MTTKPFDAVRSAPRSTTGHLAAFARGLLPLQLVLIAPAAVQAQFSYTTDHGAITITGGCPGSAGAVAIPDTLSGLPITRIGQRAFSGCTSLTRVTIGNRVLSIEQEAFRGCASLTNVMIPNSVTSLGESAFAGCTGLTSATIPGSVTNVWGLAFSGCSGLASVTICASHIGYAAFGFCTGLTSVSIDSSVTRIGDAAFIGCTGLTGVTLPDSLTQIDPYAFSGCVGLTRVTIPDSVSIIGWNAFQDCIRLGQVCFRGDAPEDTGAFGGSPATLCYLPGTTGWGPTFGGRPTAPWILPNPVILGFGPGFGVRTNQLGFVISWATNANVVVEASADLANPTWSPVSTNILKDGSVDFRDRDWASHPARFYRVRGE